MRSRTLFGIALVYAVLTAACMLPHRMSPGGPAERATRPDLATLSRASPICIHAKPARGWSACAWKIAYGR